MKLHDGGATVLIVIAIAYFANFLHDTFTTPAPQCLYQRTENGETVSRWADCKPEDLTLGAANEQQEKRN